MLSSSGQIILQYHFIYAVCMLQSYDQGWAARWPALPLALIEIEAVQMKYILLAIFNKGAYTPLDGGHSSIWWMTKSRREEEEMEWTDTKKINRVTEEAVFQSHFARGVSLTNPDASLLSKPSATMFYLHYCWWNSTRQLPAPVCVFITCMYVKLCFLK